MTGVWVTNDTISATRMNEKTIFQGSGSDINGLTTYAGMQAYCTSSGNGFFKDKLYIRNSSNTAWVRQTGQTLDQVYPLSTTIGDYTTPTSGFVSSGTHLATDGDADLQLGNGTTNTVEERGVRLNGWTSGTLGKVQVLLKKTGSPTGNIQCEVFNSIIIARPSGAPITNGTSSTIDVSTLTTSYALYTFTFSTPPTVGASHWIVFHYAGGDESTNYVSIKAYTRAELDDPCNALNANHSGDYMNSPATGDIVFIALTSGGGLLDRSSTSAITFNHTDNNTGTTLTTSSENNPFITIDASSAQDIVAIAVNLNRTSTTETQIQIKSSVLGTFTDSVTMRLIDVSDFTDDTWRFISLPRQLADYKSIQIYGVSNSVVLSINEIKYLSKTNAQFDRGHFHHIISSTSVDPALDSN